MKTWKRKLILSAMTALTGSLSDLAGQMASGQLVNVQRLVLVGLAVGTVTRVVGAVLAKLALEEDEPESPAS